MSNGNIYIKQGANKGIYLYTAKDGKILPKILKNALVRGRERWGDTQALTRVIFAEMIQKDVLSNTGFGISAHLGDNDNFIIAVDDKIEKIGFFTESGAAFKYYTFDQFIALTDAALDWRTVCPGRFADADNNANANLALNRDPYPMQ